MPLTADVKEHLLKYSQNGVEDLCKSLETTTNGLTNTEAEARLKQYGPNEVAQKRRLPWWKHLANNLNSPFNYLLLSLGTLSLISGNMASAILISAMVLLSVVLRFFQEYRSDRAAEKLAKMVTNRVSVYRRPSQFSTQGQLIDIAMSELVPGDIVHLSAGDLIPADIRLFEAKNLHINQSTLTGESLPVEKNVTPTVGDASESFIALNNICYMGTSVASGMGKAVVFNTGSNTYFGNLAAKITTDEEPPTRFEQGMDALSWLLIRFIIVMVITIFLINALSKGEWLTALLFALSVGVGLTPELLPMIVTTNLSRGALALSSKKVIVKRLSAIQHLGAMDILCTDKTGTLTQNEISLYQHLDLHGRESMEVLHYAYLNSHFESGLKNLLDKAILDHAELKDLLKIGTDFAKVDEIPFDFERRCLSVVVSQQGKHILICKGAVEEVLSRCTHVRDKDQQYPLTAAILKKMQAEAEQFNQEGYRVIAIAIKETSPSQQEYSAEDEKDMVLVGYIAFLDPPKETTMQAIQELEALGIELKILTGDNERITQKICEVAGLSVKGILLGSEIEHLNNAELAERAEHSTIFAKLTPDQKERIIEALRAKNHVTGFLGDGINDSPALKAADVGLSVNNAVDIAKESADIIILEQNLLVLKDGVIEGRKVFGNILKYLRMTTSSNFGNSLSMVGASLLLPFLPMLPIHILVQNLLYDFSQTALPFDRVDDEFLQTPHRWEIPSIQRFILTFGPVSSLFDYALFSVMWFVFQANTPAHQSLFQTGWFIEGLLSQTLIIHIIRTRKIPFLQSWAAPQLIFTTILIMAIGIYLPFSPLSGILGFVAPPDTYFWWLLGILTSYVVLVQLVKQAFIHKYGLD